MFISAFRIPSCKISKLVDLDYLFLSESKILTILNIIRYESHRIVSPKNI